MNKPKLHTILRGVGITLWLTCLMSCHKRDPLPVPEPPFERLQEAQQMKSSLLRKTIQYAVLLPESYTDTSRRFPVVYLLHGFGDNQEAWYKGGRIQWYAGQHAALLGEVIFVMPQGFNTYWVNKYNGSFPLQDMLTEELIPLIDSAYRTKADPGQRALMGYSMGGYGALMTAAKNPDYFQTAVALSMSFRTDAQYLLEPQSVFDYQWAPVFGGQGMAGQARLNPYFIAHSPFHFFATEEASSRRGQRYLIDCGDDEESLSFTSNALHSLLMDNQINHEYRMRSGGHSWDYWHASLPEAFSFMRHAFDGLEWPMENQTTTERRQTETGQLVKYAATDNLPEFTVLMPAGYDQSTAAYPLIVMLSDPKELEPAGAGTRLLEQLNQAIFKQRLPSCIVVEMPFKIPFHGDEILPQLKLFLREHYRLRTDGNYAVIIANGAAGAAVFDVRINLADTFNAMLLFNAQLPETLITELSALAFYLDMTDQHDFYKGYEQTYLAVREQGNTYEYRVRQGSDYFRDFETGLNDAMIFIKDQLKQ